ncbi:MAG: MalY/PatB family protein [bacterium]
MQYDFTSIIDRRGKDALAVDAVGDPRISIAPAAPDEGFDLIPLWVADMNFPTLPDIQEAIIQRAGHPMFGYYLASDAYFESILRWQAVRNGVTGLDRDAIGYENGVLGGLISAMQVLGEPGTRVLLHSPAYVGFTGTLKAGGYDIVHSPLKKDGQGIWRMDLEDMEEKFKSGIRILVFCSPHNPCGRVWEKEELEDMMDLCRRFDVTVISDEIWSDIILEGYRHVPVQSVSEDAAMRTVALYAPSKTFNLAGLIGAYHIIRNEDLRKKIRKQSSICHYNEMNVLSMHALTAAYSDHGMEWVDQLRQVIGRNADYSCGYIKERFDGVSVSPPQGTYMLFADCTRWCREHGKTIEDVEKAAWRVGCAVQDGRAFFGPCHLRINLASPFSRIEEAFDRLDRYVFGGDL